MSSPSLGPTMFASSLAFSMVETILGGWEGASIGHWAFIRRQRLIQTFNLKGGGLLLDRKRLFRSGRLLDH